MRVIDKFMRQKSVQQRFNRRIGRRRIQQCATLGIDHIFIRKLFKLPQLTDRIKPDGRQAWRLDIAHIPSRPFNAQHVYFIAGGIGQPRLYRCVAATMKDKAGVIAQQLGRIDAKREVFADVLGGVRFDRRPRGFFGPSAFHTRTLVWRLSGRAM